MAKLVNVVCSDWQIPHARVTMSCRTRPHPFTLAMISAPGGLAIAYLVDYGYTRAAIVVGVVLCLIMIGIIVMVTIDRKRARMGASARTEAGQNS